MRLNNLKPAKGSKKQVKRLGRGIGCGKGKTCGRGHKGQKARAGFSLRRGFEGGQMPLHRRIPKFGFKSRIGKDIEEVALNKLQKIEDNVIDLETLKKVNMINKSTKRVKVIFSGKIEKAVNVKGLKITKGAEKAILDAGGKVE